MFFKLYNKLRKKNATNAPIVSTDIVEKEVIIPVGGITPGGIVYEKEVRPAGNTPIYKEVRIEDDPQSKEEKATTDNTNTAINK